MISCNKFYLFRTLIVLPMFLVLIFLPQVLLAQTYSDSSNVNLTVTIEGEDEEEEDEEITPPSGGGGGGGGANPSAPTGVMFSGRAYPLSRVSILKDGQLAVTTIAGPNAIFSVSLTNLAAGSYSFGVYGEDQAGRRSETFTFPVYITNGATTNVSGIFITPTIAVDKAQVRRGDNIAIFGQSAPSGNVTIEVNSENQIFVQTQADSNGVYLYNFDSAPLEIGQHLTRSKVNLQQEVSTFGRSVVFAVGNTNILVDPNQRCPVKADLNRDCKVNLVDFSIAAFWYKRPLNAAFRLLEQSNLSGDGQVDLRDFSIMAYYWTG